MVKAAAAFDLAKLVLPSSADVFSGSLSLTLERDERRLLLRRLVAGLKQGEEPLFDLEGECRVDLSSPAGAVTAQLAASSIDAPKLLALIPGPRGSSARGRAGEAAARFSGPARLISAVVSRISGLRRS